MTSDYTYSIQGVVGGLPYHNTNQMSLKLLVGYCEELKPHTNYQNCSDTTETSKNLNYWFNANKMISKFINFDHFPQNGVFDYQAHNDFTSL